MTAIYEDRKTDIAHTSKRILYLACMLPHCIEIATSFLPQQTQNPTHLIYLLLSASRLQKQFTFTTRTPVAKRRITKTAMRSSLKGLLRIINRSWDCARQPIRQSTSTVTHALATYQMESDGSNTTYIVKLTGKHYGQW